MSEIIDKQKNRKRKKVLALPIKLEISREIENGTSNASLLALEHDVSVATIGNILKSKKKLEITMRLKSILKLIELTT